MKRTAIFALGFCLWFLAAALSGGPSRGAPQGPEITGLTLTSTSGYDLTTDDLTCAFTLAGTATTSATAWYKDGSPVMALYTCRSRAEPRTRSGTTRATARRPRRSAEPCGARRRVRRLRRVRVRRRRRCAYRSGRRRPGRAVRHGGGVDPGGQLCRPFADRLEGVRHDRTRTPSTRC